MCPFLNCKKWDISKLSTFRFFAIFINFLEQNPHLGRIHQFQHWTGGEEISPFTAHLIQLESKLYSGQICQILLSLTYCWYILTQHSYLIRINCVFWPNIPISWESKLKSDQAFLANENPCWSDICGKCYVSSDIYSNRNVIQLVTTVGDVLYLVTPTRIIIQLV